MTFSIHTSRPTLRARWVRDGGRLVCLWRPVPTTTTDRAPTVVPPARARRPVRLSSDRLPASQAVLRALTDRIAASV